MNLAPGVQIVTGFVVRRQRLPTSGKAKSALLEMNLDDKENYCNPATRQAITAVVARRRFAAVYAAKPCERRNCPNTKPNRNDWQSHVCREGTSTLRRMYRLYIWSFYHILMKLWDELETKDKAKEVYSSGSEYCAEVRLKMTFMYLVGRSIWGIQRSFEASTVHSYRSL